MHEEKRKNEHNNYIHGILESNRKKPCSVFLSIIIYNIYAIATFSRKKVSEKVKKKKFRTPSNENNWLEIFSLHH